VYSDVGKLSDAGVWLERALSLDGVRLVRVTTPLAVGSEAVRHPAHAARLLTLLGVSAVGGAAIDADALLLRDWPPSSHHNATDDDGNNIAMADSRRGDVDEERPAAQVLWRDDAASPLRRASLGWLAACSTSPFVWRLWAAALAVYDTYSWDAQFSVAASVLTELFPDEVRRVDGRAFDGGATHDNAAALDAFLELLETSGEQFDGVAALRLHGEAVRDTGMTLPSWHGQPPGGARSSLLCETRAHVVPLDSTEQLFFDARWAFRSQRYVDATSLLEQYLFEAEPRHVPHASLFDDDELDESGSMRVADDDAPLDDDALLPSASLPTRPDRERAFARILLVCCARARVCVVGLSICN
jgi:hypothetical protein